MVSAQAAETQVHPSSDEEAARAGPTEASDVIFDLARSHAQ
jgi:hypothetical protein